MIDGDDILRALQETPLGAAIDALDGYDRRCVIERLDELVLTHTHVEAVADEDDGPGEDGPE
jgi:hypothetical protein